MVSFDHQIICTIKDKTPGVQFKGSIDFESGDSVNDERCNPRLKHVERNECQWCKNRSHVLRGLVFVSGSIDMNEDGVEAKHLFVVVTMVR